MKKDVIKNSELVYYENLAEQKIADNEKKRQKMAGENWGHIGGVFYKTSKILYVLLAAYSLFFNLVLMLGWTLDLVGRSVYNTSHDKLIIITVITLVLITALVLILLKKPKIIIATALTIPGSVTSAFATWQWYNTSGTNYIATGHQNNQFAKYWICNFPVVFLSVFAIILLIIILKDKRELKKLTTRTIRGLYDKKIGELREDSDDGEVGMLSDEQWISVLKEYTEGQTDKKKKRSLKHKDKKISHTEEELDEE